ncbi:hypothetical protein L0Y65_04045 [Candidatus Micrarchaeota archaeon]|nr:hypothetical protein [Candidatus Micrarchaeota archaeon]
MDIKRQKKPGAGALAPAPQKPPLEEPAEAMARPNPACAPPAAAAAQTAGAGAQAPVSAPDSAPLTSQSPITASAHADEAVLLNLPDGAFLDFAHSAFDSLKLGSPQDVLLAAIEHGDIALILKVAKQRSMLGPLLSRGPAASKPSTPAPAASYDGPEAHEATVASDVCPALEPYGPPASAPPPAPPATKATRPPPPPLARRKSSEPPPSPVVSEGVPLSAVNAFILEIKDSGESTPKRLERAKEFLKKQVREIVAAHGLEEFKKAEVSAARKKEQADKGIAVPFTPLEEKIADLFELNKLIAWLARRMKSEGGVHEVLEANNGKNGDAGAQPQKAPASQSAPPAAVQPAAPIAAPAAKALPSAPAAAEDEKASAGGTPPSAPRKKSGALRRLFSSYTTWSVAGIGAFSGALAYTGGFRDMAFGARRVAELLSGRQIPDIPVMWAAGAYAAAMATIISVSLLVKRSMERRRAEREYKRAQRSSEDRGKMNYVFKKLSEIVLNYTKTEDQKSQIRQAMRTDEKLFLYMYALRKDAIFDDILEDARVPKMLRGILSQVMIPGLELELMEKRLRRFADLIYDPMRLPIFEKTYAEDPVFRTICDEIFKRNLDNDYVDPARARALFRAIENSKRENVGEPLLKALEDDYAIVSSRKK